MNFMRLRRRSAWTALQKEGRIVVGPHTYGAPNIEHYAHDSTRLVIGPYCSIASNVTFVLGGNHKMHAVSTFPFRLRWELDGAGEDGQPWSKGQINVGADVWIGTGATILSGVDIGTGSVIAARSVVTKSCEPFSILAGNPAKVVGRRFSEDIARRIIATNWWTWPEPFIREHIQVFADEQDVSACVGKLEGLATKIPE